MKKSLTLLAGAAFLGGIGAAQAAEPFDGATPLSSDELASAAGMFALAAADATSANVSVIEQLNVAAVAALTAQLNDARVSQGASSHADAIAIHDQIAAGNVFVGALVQQ